MVALGIWDAAARFESDVFYQVGKPLSFQFPFLFEF